MKLHIDPSKLVIYDKLVKRQRYDDGRLYEEKYYLNGELHNPNGPAYRSWHANGRLWSEEYYLNGNPHNPNGPAYRSWYENGRLSYELYYLDGIHYPKEYYDKLVNTII